MGKQDELSRLWVEYCNVTILRQAADGRRLVCGAGPLTAPVAVVGEAPGEQEELRGEPFVGPAGKLLQRMLGSAGIPWEACYRTNVLAWRPPGNRTPYPFQVVASRPRLMAELAVIDPAIVIAAGATAWQCLSANEHGRFTEARGQWLDDWDGPCPLLAVYHPSAILRAHGLTEGQMREETMAALRSARRSSSAAG